MKLLNKICLAPLALLLFVSAAHAEFLYFSDQTLRNFKASNARFAKRAAFLTPNEHYPSLALPAFKESIRGVYISVGTERGFIGAAFSHATHLLLVDIHPDVAEFNRINVRDANLLEFTLRQSKLGETQTQTQTQAQAQAQTQAQAQGPGATGQLATVGT